ncbi:MAG: PAS domain S-box protein [Anaerolineae bacterium]
MQSWRTKWWFVLLDLALLVTILLLPFVESELLLIFVFFFLTLGAFYWEFRAFVLRSGFWVAVTTVVVLIALRSTEIYVEELVEIVVLSGILAIVYIIVGQRKRAQEALREANLDLENRVVERTAALTRLNDQFLQEIVERKRTEATLRHSQEQLRKLSRAVEQSPSIVIITDLAGGIEYVNPKFCQTTGYTLEEVMGQNPHILKSDDTSRGEYKRLWETIAAGGEWRGQFHNRKKNGEFYWVSSSISPIRDPEGNITHFLAVQEDITELKHTEEAIEQERHRLARELHDTVTQSLYSIALAAKTSLKLLGQAGADDKMRNPLELISSLAQSALTEVREQIFRLAPTTLADKGLIEALAQHCKLLRNNYDLTIEFNAEPGATFSMDQQEVLYYTAREALWNVVKHANASRADVSLGTEDDRLVLSIADDGAGFDPAASIGKETMGLRNMADRVKLLGGTFEVQSGPGQGSRIVARIPKRNGVARKPR